MREIKKIKKTFSEPLEDIEEETKKIKKGD
jgi:hypothetical protein